MRILNTIIIASALLVSSVAFADDPTSASSAEHAQQAGDRAVITDMLRPIDTVPNADALKERFPSGEALLVTIATDTDENLYVRKRATTLLSVYGTADAARGLETIAADAELRPFAVYTLARAFGANADSGLVARIANFLEDDSLEVREWTVRGLRWVRHDDARSLLERVAADDSEPKLQSLATRSLKRWKPAPVDTPSR
jgi:HEAT repeat protein